MIPHCLESGFQMLDKPVPVITTHISKHLPPVHSPLPPWHSTLQIFSTIFSSPNEPYSSFWRVSACYYSLYTTFPRKAVFIFQLSDVSLYFPRPGNLRSMGNRHYLVTYTTLFKLIDIVLQLLWCFSP